MIYNEESVLLQTWKRRVYVFGLLLLTLCITVLPVWQKIGLQPTPLLIVLYHWSIYRSDLLPVEQLILISLVVDGIYAYPLGFSALRLLLDYLLLLSQKRILCHQRFHWIWGGFGIFILVDSCIFLTLLYFVKHEWPGILPLIPGMILTVGIYPFMIWTLNRFVKKHLTT
jgi:rod shape-determining protein MreD